MAFHKPNENAFAILERRKNVSRRYLRGETQWEIARAFEVSQATISIDLAAIRKAWLESAILDMDALKAKELAKVDEVEREAWGAWTKSQQDAQTLKDRKRGGEQTVEKVSRGQAGDPRFLTMVLACVERRCKILGLEPQDNRNKSPEGLLRDSRVAEALRADPGAADLAGRLAERIVMGQGVAVGLGVPDQQPNVDPGAPPPPPEPKTS